MRDVNYGWLLRYLHANGASMFFLAVYIHMFRGLYYGSYKAPREVLWILGVHHLPADDGDRLHGLRAALGPDELLGRDRHHQPVLGAFPVVGEPIATWLWGGFAVGNPTLQPLLLAALPAAVRDRRRRRSCTSGRCTSPARTTRPASSRSPTRTPCRSRPTATVKDGFAMVVLPASCSPGSCSTCPNYLGHADNYIPANPLVTPAHIVPEWYFLPFYAILRAIPNKLVGVLAHVRLDRASWPSCPGSTPRRCARRATARSTASSSGSSSRSASASAISARKPPEGGYVIASRILTALLLRALPHHPAAARLVREAQAAAELDLRVGAAQKACRRRVEPAPARPSARDMTRCARSFAARSPARSSALAAAAHARRRARSRRRGRRGRSPVRSASSTAPSCSAASRSTGGLLGLPRA